MVKDSERYNTLPPYHRTVFPINTKGSFICIILDRIAHTTAFVYTSCVALTGTRNSPIGPIKNYE